MSDLLLYGIPGIGAAAAAWVAWRRIGPSNPLRVAFTIAAFVCTFTFIMWAIINTIFLREPVSVSLLVPI